MERLKIYLAGKIGKGDWRHSLVEPRAPEIIASCFDNSELPQRWSAIPRAIFGEHTYTGPFFIGCDHGCFHGTNSHGTLSYLYDPDEDQAQAILEERRHREQVTALCKAAIRDSDLVFAWIESLDAYGTLAEIGYAYALNKYVALAFPGGLPAEWWFTTHGMAHQVHQQCPSPRIGLQTAIEFKTGDAMRNLCESPIEKQFFNAAWTRLPGLTPQVKIGRYRVDFAIPDKGIVIELDGHDSHKTKEQRTNDAKRQRYLEKEGWRVIRFTGSEIYRDVQECVNEVVALMPVLNGAAP